MSKEENSFLSIIASLQTFKEEIEEAFEKRADQNGRINQDGVFEVIDDISVILAFDFESAKNFFSYSNKQIPEGYNIKSLTLNEFQEILHIWLRQEASRASELAKSSFVSAPTVERTKTVINSNAFRANTQGITRTKTRLKTASGFPPNYQANKKLLDELIRNHRAEWKEIFNDRLLEEGQETIAIFDCFNVLQESFYIDRVDLMERASDPEDFFQSVGSYKRLFSLAEDYFLNEKNASPVDFDIREKTMSFDECLELLYYWIKSDEYVVLIDNRVKDDAGGVKKALLATIENYEQMLQDAKSEIEKQVLQTTVDTLYKKLEELENGFVEAQEQKIS